MKTTTLCAVTALTAMTLAANAAFLPSGKMALGANYWASHAATEMWRKWDAKAVDEDLRVLAACACSPTGRTSSPSTPAT